MSFTTPEEAARSPKVNLYVASFFKSSCIMVIHDGKEKRNE